MSTNAIGLKEMLFGLGYCNRCGLIKPLAMVAITGTRIDKETGEIEGGILHLDPLERSGFCEPCALEWCREQKQ